MSDCAVPCECEQCCDTCQSIQCVRTIVSNVTAVDPAVVGLDAPGPVSAVTVLGGEFADSHNISCAWRLDVVSSSMAPLFTAGLFLSIGAVRCPLPPAAALRAALPANGTTVNIPVSVSLSGPGNASSFTPLSSASSVRFFACNPPCAAGAGVCQAEDATCACSDGFGGPTCAVRCPVNPTTNAICSGGDQGVCDAATGSCVCLPGYEGFDCAQSGSLCPPGRFGPMCAETCPGTSGCNGTACASVCSNHGQCAENGQCVCDGASGFFGVACDQMCPSGTVGPDGASSSVSSLVPCSGHGRCSADGFCQCNSGWGTSNCAVACPVSVPSGGSSPVVCGGTGSCNSATGSCDCLDGYWGAACDSTCPGSSQCGGSTGCAVVCSGHGICASSSGQCACQSGFWGSSCANACPATSSGPCAGHGRCSPSTGQCLCDVGFGGVVCENACPLGANGLVCSGAGVCLASNATCACNPTYSGAACEVRACVQNCYGHGTCLNGVCQCEDAWEGDYCSRAKIPAGSGVVHWVTAHVDATEESGTLALNVTRDGSVSGPVTVHFICVSLTAQEGVDFLCQDGALTWADGEAGPQTVFVQILEDDLAEGVEVFELMLTDLSAGASFGEPVNLTVSITPSDVDELAKDSVQVVLRVLVPEASIRQGSEGGALFSRSLVADLADETVLHTVSSRLLVESIAPALGGQRSLITLDILPPPPTLERERVAVSSASAPNHLLPVLLEDQDENQDQRERQQRLSSSSFPPAPDRTRVTALNLADALVSLVANQQGPLFAAERSVSRSVDSSFEPIVRVNSGSVPTNDRGDAGRGLAPWAIALLVVLPLALLAGCAVAAWRNRRRLSEWVLWRAAQMRFTGLADEHQRQLEFELEGLEAAKDAGSPSAAISATAAVAAATAATSVGSASRYEGGRTGVEFDRSPVRESALDEEDEETEDLRGGGRR